MKLGHSDSRGFTLPEVLIVLLMLALLSGLAAPTFTQTIKNYRIKAVSRQLVSDLQSAKMKAISANTNYQVVFDVANVRYMVQKSDGSDSGPWRNLGNDGVTLTNNFTGNVVFTPIGEAVYTATNPLDNATVTVSTSAATPKTVSVASSGRISVG